MTHNLPAGTYPPPLTCPNCGHDATHARPNVEMYDNRPPEQRWSFRIPMWCEDGHDFTLVVEQHKGSTLILTRRNK
jgi:hypothetical protein